MSKVRVEVQEGVAVLELNDPPANTYSYEMMQAIDAAVLAARMDAGVHVIVLIGAGEKFFCAGANIGMCNIFSGILPANVKIRYQYTGLGYAGRPGSTPARAGGPVPTITVSVIGLSYNYFFLSGLMNLTSVTMPPLATTVTGEDLNVN